VLNVTTNVVDECPWGLLPFAEGHVGRITATYDKRVGVVLRGVNQDFVAATKQAKRNLG